MKLLITSLVTIGGVIPAALAQEPVGFWDFSSQMELIRDRSGQGNDLQVQGCDWVQSKLGPALRVPARMSRVWCDKPGAVLRPTEALGIVAWVRPLGTGQSCAVVRHGKGSGEDGTAGYQLMVFREGVRLLLGAGRIINISGGLDAVRIVRQQWNQVAATYDGREAVAFINGEAVARTLVQGPINYAGVDGGLEVGSAEGGNLDGDIASLKVFDRALSAAAVAADWEAGKRILLAPEEITAQLYAKLEKCSLTQVPTAPFVRDRHTTLLAHMDASDKADADYSRWDGRAGGWRLKYGVPGRFGLATELPSGERTSGAPILYRGAGNVNMQRGTCEFWIRAAEGIDVLADDKDRYLLTILPEFYLGYGDRPGVHFVMRTHAATQSLQFAANTDRIDWYWHLSGARIADSAKTTLHLPLNAFAAPGWHHVLCSWSMEGEGRIWLFLDGKGVTTKLDQPPKPKPQIPAYKIFLGGSYFPEIYCPSARAVIDEFRITDQTVAARVAGYQTPPPRPARIDEPLMMRGEDLCRYFLDFTAKLQMGGGWENSFTWPNLMPDESPGSYAAATEDEYTMRDVTPAFLRAYELFGEDRYLRVAENCGQMLVKTQDDNGAWCQGYIIMPDQAHPVAPGVGSIEEGTQADPLRVLFWLWRLTGKPEYRDAGIKSAQFVLRGQKPDGAWPLTVNSRTMKPGGGYTGYSTLNDGATLWGMKSMLMGWHLTQDRQFLEALRKAGHWLISAQLPGKARGWAEQYDDNGGTMWARHFEPPAAILTATAAAANALFLMYDLTADETYLAPLRTCVEWGANMPEEYKGYSRYDPETGVPIMADGYKIYRLGDPAFKNPRPRRRGPDFFKSLKDRIEARTRGPLIPAPQGLMPRADFERGTVTAETVAASLDRIRAATDTPFAHLAAFQRGEFPAGGFLNEHPRHGRAFWPGRGTSDLQRVLYYILAAKVIAGELDAASAPRYADDYFGFIDPARDWYQTPLLRSAAASK